MARIGLRHKFKSDIADNKSERSRGAHLSDDK